MAKGCTNIAIANCTGFSVSCTMHWAHLIIQVLLGNCKYTRVSVIFFSKHVWFDSYSSLNRCNFTSTLVQSRISHSYSTCISVSGTVHVWIILLYDGFSPSSSFFVFHFLLFSLLSSFILLLCIPQVCIS